MVSTKTQSGLESKLQEKPSDQTGYETGLPLGSAGQTSFPGENQF